MLVAIPITNNLNTSNVKVYFRKNLFGLSCADFLIPADHARTENDVFL